MVALAVVLWVLSSINTTFFHYLRMSTMAFYRKDFARRWQAAVGEQNRQQSKFERKECQHTSIP